MGILTLGLLGVAAIFPVGGWYLQKADIADRGSAIAQSVMSDIVARGMLNPNSWYTMVPTADPKKFPSPANITFSVDGKFTATPNTLIRGTFTRPFALALREALLQSSASTDPTWIGKQFGAAFVIDPLGVAAMAMPSSFNTGRNLVANPFPATIWNLPPGSFYSWQTKWGGVWPVRRVSFQQPVGGWQFDRSLAESLFRGSDDLATELPSRADRPAQQKWDTVDVSGTQRPLARQWTGDYSWIVTVAPTTVAARDGMAKSPESYEYDVSVVVFHKRVLPAAPPTTNTDADENAKAEEAVKARIVSTGLSGGEVLLESLATGSTESPFKDLKVGQWVMLCGPHPNGTATDPRFVLNWYQVLSIEGKDERLNSQGTTTPLPASNDPERRLIAVRGPQWPWQPSASSNDPANGLCVAICRGAVAVHSKTLKLQSPRDAGMSLYTPAGVTPGNVLY